MTAFLIYAVLGAGTGAVLGLLAVGIVLIFRGAGVVNIAHGAYAMLAAFLYWDFLNHGWALAPAMAASIAAIAVVGLATDQILLRSLRNASSLTRFIATVGMMLLLQGVAQKIWGTNTQSVAPIIPSHPIHVSGSVLPSDRLWLLAIAVFLTVCLTLVWRYTRLGWIAEAVSENDRLAATLGWSPAVVSGITWAVGAALAGLAGILIAPITELNVATMPLLIVPALAAALVGGFRSFPLTLAGAAAIGAGQSELLQYVHVTGAADALPFLVIAGGLMLRGSPLPLRGHVTERLPRVGSGRVRWRVVLPACAAVIVALAAISSADWLAALTSTFAVATMLLGLVVLIGYAGQVSLAQYALAGFGALFAGHLASDAGFPFVLALVVGALGASVVGVIFALPALRTRGVNLAVVTLGLALAAQSVIFNNGSLTGGFNGLIVPTPSLFGWSMDPIGHPGRYAIFAFVVFVLVALAVARLRRTPPGRMMLAIRDNERAAASNGISVLRGKVIAFAIAGAIAGLGGIVLAFQQPILQFGGYDPLTSINFLADSVIGGVGFVLGPLFGAMLYPGSVGSILSLHWPGVNSWITVVAAVGLLVTLVLNPNGWIHEVSKPLRHLLRWQWLSGKPSPSSLEVDADQGGEYAPLVGLSARGITVRYGGNVAVDGVDLTVEPGQIVGLIGPNGAGKTSFMDAITGFTGLAEGSVALGDSDITRWSAHRRARAGIARSFQTLELYPDMTVRENMLSATEPHDLISMARAIFARRKPRFSPFVAGILRDFRLEGVLERLPEELSYGQRRLLAIARALAMRPAVLLVDEPVAGVDETESVEIGRMLRSVAEDRNIGVLVVEHDMPFVMSVCDRIQVIDFGRPVTAGTPREIRDDELAIAAYLGEETHDGQQTDGAPATADLVMGSGGATSYRNHEED